MCKYIVWRVLALIRLYKDKTAFISCCPLFVLYFHCIISLSDTDSYLYSCVMRAVFLGYSQLCYTNLYSISVRANLLNFSHVRQLCKNALITKK